MLKLDNNLLDELGLGSLPEDQKRAMLQHIYETLELRVGTNLANQMSDQQLEEFEKFIDDGGDANQAQALQWLETNLPNYKEVVNQVFEALKGEIKQMAPQLVATSVAQPQMPAQQPPAAQPQPPIPPAPAPSAPPAYQAPMPPQPQPQQPPPVPPTAPTEYYQTAQSMQPPHMSPQPQANEFPPSQPQPPAGPNPPQPPQYPGQQAA